MLQIDIVNFTIDISKNTDRCAQENVGYIQEEIPLDLTSTYAETFVTTDTCAVTVLKLLSELNLWKCTYTKKFVCKLENIHKIRHEHSDLMQ